MATIMEPETQEQAGAARPTPAGGGAAPAASPGGRRRTVFLIMGVVLLGLLGLGARRWWFNLSHVSTDNAQVDGHIIPILPKVGGFVTAVRVDENQRVKDGDTLVALDDRDYRVRLAQAEADLAVALAGVSNKARVGQAEAQVEQAQANALKARADLDRLRPLAEQDIVSKQQLDAAQAGARAADAALAAADVRPGDPVDFTVDPYPGLHFKGHVESLSPATGARFSLLPPDNATGNFTKVVQRLPVRLRPDKIDPAHPLRPGMSVVVTIQTR